MVSNNPGHPKVLENVCLVGNVLTFGGSGCNENSRFKGLRAAILCSEWVRYILIKYQQGLLFHAVRTLQFEEQSARACENSGWSPADSWPPLLPA